MYYTLIWEQMGFFWWFFAVFQHMVFADGFLILIKELGLLSNSGQWIRGLIL
jgi:hypothetical protein